MRKQFLVILTILISSFTFGQVKGVKIGYIDMEFILQNVPNYAEAKNQLEQKAQKWKQEIEVRKSDVLKLKDALKTEKVLLTKELIAERQEEISFQENELLEYNQKRFGPTGDLIIQKSVLVKPIQDQIFTIVQDISEAKKYDFIFDKSSDMTMLFASKRFDISDQVLRVLNRAEKREQMTKKQIKLEEEKDAKEDFAKENPEKAERQKILDDKKLVREQFAKDKKAAAEAKKKTAEENRKNALLEKGVKKVENVPTNDSTKIKISDAKANADSIKQAAVIFRAKTIEEKKKNLEDRKNKILQDREAAKKAKEDKLKVKPIN
jgi:Skp family chaperone for outer membrane proteins